MLLLAYRCFVVIALGFLLFRSDQVKAENLLLKAPNDITMMRRVRVYNEPCPFVVPNIPVPFKRAKIIQYGKNTTVCWNDEVVFFFSKEGDLTIANKTAFKIEKEMR